VELARQPRSFGGVSRVSVRDEDATEGVEGDLSPVRHGGAIAAAVFKEMEMARWSALRGSVRL
jgi:hypothetical protein